MRFYDADKGFGFLTKDEGGDVYVRSTALPAGVTTLKPGQKVEFGVVEGRRPDVDVTALVLGQEAEALIGVVEPHLANWHVHPHSHSPAGRRRIGDLFPSQPA